MVCVIVIAQTPLVKPDLHQPSLIAPAYFGPNAFPIPDMLSTEASGNLQISLSGEGHLGYAGDRTADLFAHISIPLFTPRARLTLWMPVMEWYENTIERQAICRLPTDEVMRGHEAGDAYVSTDILLLQERRYVPAIAIRACLRSASGGGYYNARYYDGPGYFFDAAFGKTFATPNELFSLHLAASAGFLCWQTDNGRQNDAVMYGVEAKMTWQIRSTALLINAFYGGYVGWEDAGDKPMTVKATLSCLTHGFEPFVAYRYGIHDCPWHSVTIGLKYDIKIIK